MFHIHDFYFHFLYGYHLDENVLILIIWLHKKPSDLDLYCVVVVFFQKIKKIVQSVLIRLNMPF